MDLVTSHTFPICWYKKTQEVGNQKNFWTELLEIGEEFLNHVVGVLGVSPNLPPPNLEYSPPSTGALW